MNKIFLCLVFVIAACAPAGVAATTTADTAGAVKRAVGSASGDDTVYIMAGEYDVGEIKIRRNLTVIGLGDVTLYSSEPLEKGIFNPLPDVSLRVENITFKDAQSPDLNGAGIRHDGANLTVVNCQFNNNENGILSTGDPNGRIVIFGSSFIDNGHGDGYSHGIYVADASSLQIVASRFSGTRIGHHIKSLARKTEVSMSMLDDAEGQTSYSIDVSGGGDVIISDNTFVQAADGDNSTIINYDLSRGGAADGLIIANNHFINYHGNGNLLRNESDAPLTYTGNKIVNGKRSKLKTP